MGPNSVSYSQYINSLTSWFDDSLLDLNVTKSKERWIGDQAMQVMQLYLQANQY